MVIQQSLKFFCKFSELFHLEAGQASYEILKHFSAFSQHFKHFLVGQATWHSFCEILRFWLFTHFFCWFFSPQTGSNGDSHHIDVYQNEMAKTYYKCDVGAVWMNLKSLGAMKGRKQWVNGLLSWQRNSHFYFDRPQEALLRSVERLLEYHSTTPLVPTVPNYHSDPLEKVKYGNICLLTLPKTCGIGWHPISVYYCFDEENEEMVTVLFEMINVPWSRRHVYVLPLRQYGSYNEQVCCFRSEWMLTVAMSLDAMN